MTSVDDEDDDVEPVLLPPAIEPAGPRTVPSPVTPAAAPPPPAAPVPPVPLPVLVASHSYGTASHQLEPFGIQPPRRRFGRRVVVETFAVEVPARIVPPVLPRQTAQE